MASKKNNGFLVCVLIKYRDKYGKKTQIEYNLFVSPTLAGYLHPDSWTQSGLRVKVIKQEYKKLGVVPVHVGEFLGHRLGVPGVHEDSIGLLITDSGRGVSNEQKLIKLCETKGIILNAK